MKAIIIGGDLEGAGAQAGLAQLLDQAQAAGLAPIDLVYPAGPDLEALAGSRDQVQVWDNPFYRNYNDLYALGLVDLGQEDLYILSGVQGVQANVFYDFESSLIMVADKEEGQLGPTYLLDDQGRPVDYRVTGQAGVQGLGVYFIKARDLDAVREALSVRSGLASLEDPALSLDQVFYEIREAIQLRTYRIPAHYIERQA